MTIKELIEKLPPDMQEAIRKQLESVMNLPFEAAQRFIDYYQRGDLIKARKELIKHMTAEELDLSMEQTNQFMRQAGMRVKTEKARNKAFLAFIFQGMLELIKVWFMAMAMANNTSFLLPPA